jgi:hypothetical protein
MGVAPVARYLVELDHDRQVQPAEQELPRPQAPTPQPSPAAAVDEAYSRGLKEGWTNAKAAFDAEIQSRNQTFDTEFAAARQTWAREQGEALVQGLAVAVDAMRGSIAEVVERILMPFVEEAVRRKAIEELIGIIELLVSKDEGVSLQIAGPQDLLQIIKERLGENTASITYLPNADCDVRVTAGKTFMETRLVEWMTRLKEVVK